MKWAHLPVAGGLYDQAPLLLDHFVIIMGIEAKTDRQREAKREREMTKTQQRLKK